ncbi:hypothetical protein Hanom_Chr13g01236441 [Helianthus anomalus]
MQNAWMGSFRLFINIVRFAKENKESKENVEVKDKMRTQNGVENAFQKKEWRREWGHKQRDQGTGVQTSDFYYERSCGKTIIGKTKDLWTLRKLDILLKEARYRKSTIKYLGGLSVLVVFKSNAEADCFRVEASGFGWFSNVEIWKGQPAAFERIAWLNIHGVSLHLSWNETFDSVGRCFGKVIHASQQQPEDNLLTSDCVCVLIDSVKRLEEVVTIIEDNKRYRVWVEEERGDWIPDLIENQDGQSEDVGSESGKSFSVDNSGSEYDGQVTGTEGNASSDSVEKKRTWEYNKRSTSNTASPESGEDIGAGSSPERSELQQSEPKTGSEEVEKTVDFNGYVVTELYNGNGDSINNSKAAGFVGVPMSGRIYGDLINNLKAAEVVGVPMSGKNNVVEEWADKRWGFPPRAEDIFKGPNNLGFFFEQQTKSFYSLISGLTLS